jgi:hypothetical protein
MRIDALPTGGLTQLNVINVPLSPSGYANLGLAAKPDGIVYIESSSTGAYEEHPLTTPITAGRVSIIEVSLTPTYATVKVDGVDAYGGASLFVPSLSTVVAGIEWANAPPGPLSIFLGDLAVYLQ